MKYFTQKILLGLQDMVSNFLYRSLAVKVAPVRWMATKAYQCTVQALLALMGEDAHCCEVDEDLWNVFSEVFKGDVGVRPRFHQTRADVKRYLEIRSEEYIQEKAESEEAIYEQIMTDGIGEPQPSVMALAFQRARA